MSSRAYDLSGLGHGLTHTEHIHVHQQLQDYSKGKLSLRRIPESDPAFAAGMRETPPRVFGVWEENVAPGQTNWVFTLAEISIDHRVLARIIANDLQREGAPERFAKLQAFEASRQASVLKRNAEIMAGRRDEMQAMGRLAGQKSSFRHRINGENVIIGDEIRPIKRTV